MWWSTVILKPIGHAEVTFFFLKMRLFQQNMQGLTAGM